MKRLILMLLVLAGALSNTESGSRIMPQRPPLPTGETWLRSMTPVTGSLFRWSTAAELRTISRGLRDLNAQRQLLPSPIRFQEYLQDNHVSGHPGVDLWGNAYFLVLTRDSVIVGSPGPDGSRGTLDDVLVSTGR